MGSSERVCGFSLKFTPLLSGSQTSGPLIDRPPGAGRGPSPLVINTRLYRTGEPLNWPISQFHQNSRDLEMAFLWQRRSEGKETKLHLRLMTFVIHLRLVDWQTFICITVNARCVWGLVEIERVNNYCFFILYYYYFTTLSCRLGVNSKASSLRVQAVIWPAILRFHNSRF